MQVVAYDVPDWGVGELFFRGSLVYHELPTARRSSAPVVSDHPLVQRVRDYFAGEPISFAEVEIDLDWCTPFQHAIADALRRVPYGETVTYGELAALAGHPNAQRAAGTFCAGNRFPLIVPCHRVVAAEGLGSYGSLGLEYKRRLLALENVPL